MKKILLVLAVVSSAMMADAQECTWGIKGGIDMTSYKLGVEDVSLKINPGSKTGFYLGVVNNFKFAEQWGCRPNFFITMPEPRLVWVKILSMR